ncbi:ATP-binding protein [Streptomyces lusitanus]|uniref:ATP-binding protein n=1 Tax=Streptomyces lusitanus TaxID=68232 RepID=A0ABU3JR28_9ACTN|nr:ATP-binding protein [Streptomyces lusitanus]
MSERPIRERRTCLLVTEGNGPVSRLTGRIADEALGLRGCPPRHVPDLFTELTLPGDDFTSGQVARHHVRDAARSWGLPAETVDDLESITGELVANALEHSDSRIVRVVCRLTAAAVTVGVTDEGGGGAAVVPGVPGVEREDGRGLLITDALAGRWGTSRAGGCLTVWAEVGVGRRA